MSIGNEYFLLAYFLSEEEADGEQVRFAVSDGPEPVSWMPLNGSRPAITSAVGEAGMRDPFLLRNHITGRFVLLGTDLRIWPGQDWDRSVRFGSRSLVVTESADLVTWSSPSLHKVSPEAAGNTWAPKAFWSPAHNAWLVFWASALYDTSDDRTAAGYQRILVAKTRDFARFDPARVHLDAGHNVIDMTFLERDGVWYRFSANAHSSEPQPSLGHHIFEERGPALDEPVFDPFVIDIGKHAMRRAEGPAVAKHPHEDRWYLLADEFGYRGYQVFDTTDLSSGIWRHRTDASLPPGARHGSLLAITADERRRLLDTDWTTA